MVNLLRSRSERLFIAIVLLVVAIQAIVIGNRRLTHGGDFDVSREFGRRLLAGEPLYAGGLHYPYMPAAALYFAPLALLPPGLALALRYATALACLWLTLRLLHRMVATESPTPLPRLALAAPTLLLASHYLLRDLDDGGPHLILLAMLMGGIFSIWRGRTLAGAGWLGLAAALKASNALFVPFFVWRRQWNLAAATAAALLFWTLLPLAWMGSASWWLHQREWAAIAAASATGAPEAGARESEERVQNQALRPVLERYFAPLGARLPAYMIVLALLGLVGWWSRPSQAHPPAWLAEASAVLILSVLLSPLAWVQHLVLLIPALYLIVAAQRAARLGAGATMAMAIYFVLAVLLNRELIGRGAYLVLLAHGLHTACMLLTLSVLMLCRPRSPS